MLTHSSSTPPLGKCTGIFLDGDKERMLKLAQHGVLQKHGKTNSSFT